jgi:hypothetical protein
VGGDQVVQCAQYDVHVHAGKPYRRGIPPRQLSDK